MTAPASLEQTAQPSLPKLRVAFRSPSHFLVSYCTNVHQGILFVQSEQNFALGEELQLSLQVPGQSSSHLLPATVCWTRDRATMQGPPGVGLSFEGVEKLLAPVVDRLVQIAQPLRIDLVGANAYTTRHLASSVQTAIDCRIQHRELRHDVVQRCMGSDLVLVDLDSNPRAALETIEQLAQSPAAPAILALCDEEDQTTLEAASQWAYLTTYPVDHRALRERIIQGLAQCSKSPGQGRSHMQDTMPLATVSAAPRPRAPRCESGSEGPSSTRPARLSLHPSHRQKTAQPWLVDASWQQRPQRRARIEPEHSPQPQRPLDQGTAEQSDQASPPASSENAHDKRGARSPESSPVGAALEDTHNDPLRGLDSSAAEESPDAAQKTSDQGPFADPQAQLGSNAKVIDEQKATASAQASGSLPAEQSPGESATLQEKPAAPEILKELPAPPLAKPEAQGEDKAQDLSATQQRDSPEPQEDSTLEKLQGAEHARAADPADSPANEPRPESDARKSA